MNWRDQLNEVIQVLDDEVEEISSKDFVLNILNQKKYLKRKNKKQIQQFYVWFKKEINELNENGLIEDVVDRYLPVISFQEEDLWDLQRVLLPLDRFDKIKKEISNLNDIYYLFQNKFEKGTYRVYYIKDFDDYVLITTPISFSSSLVPKEIKETIKFVQEQVNLYMEGKRTYFDNEIMKDIEDNQFIEKVNKIGKGKRFLREKRMKEEVIFEDDIFKVTVKNNYGNQFGQPSEYCVYLKRKNRKDYLLYCEDLTQSKVDKKIEETKTKNISEYLIYQQIEKYRKNPCILRYFKGYVPNNEIKKQEEECKKIKKNQ